MFSRLIQLRVAIVPSAYVQFADPGSEIAGPPTVLSHTFFTLSLFQTETQQGTRGDRQRERDAKEWRPHS